METRKQWSSDTLQITNRGFARAGILKPVVVMAAVAATAAIAATTEWALGNSVVITWLNT
jgi:hypothetical protein